VGGGLSLMTHHNTGVGAELEQHLHLILMMMSLTWPVTSQQEASDWLAQHLIVKLVGCLKATVRSIKRKAT
jgi:hypothetical protein